MSVWVKSSPVNSSGIPATAATAYDAVPEIQACGMTSRAKPKKCGGGGIQMFFVERDHFGLQAPQKSSE
jgi:hypothetical protein